MDGKDVSRKRNAVSRRICESAWVPEAIVAWAEGRTIRRANTLEGTPNETDVQLPVCKLISAWQRTAQQPYPKACSVFRISRNSNWKKRCLESHTNLADHTASNLLEV